jgi:hypothetical protein
MTMKHDLLVACPNFTLQNSCSVDGHTNCSKNYSRCMFERFDDVFSDANRNARTEDHLVQSSAANNPNIDQHHQRGTHSARIETLVIGY